jgi:hypothetical protein
MRRGAKRWEEVRIEPRRVEKRVGKIQTITAAAIGESFLSVAPEHFCLLDTSATRFVRALLLHYRR